MIDLTVAQIAAIVGGELADISAEDAAALHVTGTVEFDSRKVTSGGLFLALPGARTDGHDHAASAVAAVYSAGCCAALFFDVGRVRTTSESSRSRPRARSSDALLLSSSTKFTLIFGVEAC